MEKTYISSNNQLLSQLKDYIYESQFPNLEIFSKQYWKSILINKYSNNENNMDYSIIFGDFDKLNRINCTYGMVEADKCLYSAIEMIRKILPANTLLSRIAGDEFLAILEGFSTQDCQQYINSIEKILEENRNSLHGLTITLDTVNSKDFPSIEEMYMTSDAHVIAKKHRHKQNIGSFDEALQQKIKENLCNYFSFFRFPSHFNFTQEHLLTMGEHLLNTLKQKLETEQTASPSPVSAFTGVTTHFPLSQQTATLLHQSLESFGTPNDFSHLLDGNTIREFENYMIKEPLSNAFSKRYLLQYLLPLYQKVPEQLLYPTYVSVPFIKLFNSLKGHNYTDSYISKIYADVYSLLENASFNTVGFTQTEKDNVTLDFGGGNFVFLTDEKSQQEIAEKLLRHNPPTSSPFVYASSCCHAKDLLPCLHDLEQQCSKKKIPMKEQKLGQLSPCSEASMAINLALDDCISYFKQDFPNPTIEDKKHLFSLMLNSVLEHFTQTMQPEQNRN